MEVARNYTFRENRNVCHARPVMRHTVDTRDHHAAVFIGAHTAS